MDSVTSTMKAETAPDALQATPRGSHPWLTALGVLALLMMLYAASYFALLALPDSWRLPAWATIPSGGIRTSFVEVSGDWRISPDYHGLPEMLFVPMHELDRRWLRPGKWEGHYPRTGELDFDWLLKSYAPSAAGK